MILEHKVGENHEVTAGIIFQQAARCAYKENSTVNKITIAIVAENIIDALTETITWNQV